MDVAPVHLDPLRGQPGDLDRLEAPVSVFHGRGAFVAPGDVADGRQQGDPVRLDFGDHRIPTPRARFVGAVRDIYARLDRKSTRLNSSHGYISYAVFCLKKKS